MKKPVIFLFHIGYWFLYSLFILLILSLLRVGDGVNYGIPKSQFLVLWVFFFPPAIFAFYTFYSVLFDYFLSRKRILWLFLVGFAVSWLSGAASAVVSQILSWCGFIDGQFGGGWQQVLGSITIMAVIALPNGGMGLLLRGFIRWYSELKLKEDLMKKNFETELALVKSQLDPHFLFNTLSNIDALILKDKNMASDYLNKLSDIMRFMLYETKGKSIPLSKEEEYIQKYVDLQKIRTVNKDFVDLKIAENREAVEIAPMLLIPFVENAFKHAERLRTGNVIFISIKVENNYLIFNCNNRFNKNDTTTIKEVGGLGNALIVKRLELLYPKKHILTIEEKDGWYCVNLHIHLT